MMIDRKEYLKQFENLINAIADKCEGIIYHYTSSNGLLGIIENSELWLTNTAFVNDTSECKALIEEMNLSHDVRFSNKHVIEAWERFKQNPKGTDTYITSFSKGEDNILEQFRAYGNFRIGFDANKLRENPFNIFSCVYNKEEIYDWIVEKSNLKEWDENLLDDMAKSGAAFSLVYAASRKYKNHYYRNENEVRLIVTSHHTWEPYTNSPSMFQNEPPIHYRYNSKYSFSVPYVKYIQFEKNIDYYTKLQSKTYVELKREKLSNEDKLERKLLPITEVLIGPMPHIREAVLACQILLNDNGYTSVPVKLSKIPYRGF
jgi:hypothetical protein